MNPQLRLGITLVVVVAAIVAVVAGVLFEWPKLIPFFIHQATAAWVQALGSLLALAIVVLTVERQIKAAQKLEEDRRVEELRGWTQALSAVATYTYTSIKRVVKALEGDQAGATEFLQDRYMLAGLKSIEETLLSIPILEAPNWTVAAAILRLRRAVRRATLMIDDLASMSERGEQWRKTAESIKGLEKVVQQMTTHILETVPRAKAVGEGADDWGPSV